MSADECTLRLTLVDRIKGGLSTTREGTHVTFIRGDDETIRLFRMLQIETNQQNEQNLKQHSRAQSVDAINSVNIRREGFSDWSDFFSC